MRCFVLAIRDERLRIRARKFESRKLDKLTHLLCARIRCESNSSHAVAIAYEHASANSSRHAGNAVMVALSGGAVQRNAACNFRSKEIVGFAVMPSSGFTVMALASGGVNLFNPPIAAQR